MKDKKWCVAQDLEPFGWRIEKQYRREGAARRRAATSRYLHARRTAWVRQRNEDLKQDDVFWASVHANNERIEKQGKDVEW